MSVTKYKLDEAFMEDAFFEDTALIGIVSGLPAYRLCWMLNNYFDIEFACEPDMTLALSVKGNISYLPVYQYQFKNSPDRYLLYKLKVDNVSLLPETGRLDYMWLVQTATFDTDVIDIANALKKIPDITLSQILERSQLKNVKNLLV